MKSWKTTLIHATERRLVEILQIDAVESDAAPSVGAYSRQSKLDQSGLAPIHLGPTSARCSPGLMVSEIVMQRPCGRFPG